MIRTKSKIILPPSLASFFTELGYSDTTYFEGRRSTRLRIRCEAAACIEESPPSILRAERHLIVLVKDISRHGISILAHEQIWPEEKLNIQFRRRQFRATVVRCRRLGQACWECGCETQFFKHFEDESDD